MNATPDGNKLCDVLDIIETMPQRKCNVLKTDSVKYTPTHPKHFNQCEGQDSVVASLLQFEADES